MTGKLCRLDFILNRRFHNLYNISEAVEMYEDRDVQRGLYMPSPRKEIINQKILTRIVLPYPYVS